MSIRFNVLAPQSERVPAGVMHVMPIPKHISGRLNVLKDLINEILDQIYV